MDHLRTVADPRPVLDGDGRLQGSRCGCGFATAPAVPRCPACGRPANPATFPASGRVWSSTVVRAAAGDVVPYVVTYVDVVDGPRILTRSTGDAALPIDTEVALATAPGGSLAPTRVGVSR